MQPIPYKAVPLWRCPLVLVLAQVLADSVLLGAGDVPVMARLLSYAAGTVLLAFLLLPLPVQDKPLSVVALTSWSGLSAACAALSMALRAGVSLPIQQVCGLTLGVFTLVLLLGSLTAFLATLLRNTAQAQRSVLVLVLLAAAAPLWLGPLAEHLTQRPALINGIVAASPLNYLAVMAEYDLLRSAWFYQHTPLGGLRYAYPAPLPFTTTGLLLAVLLLLARRIVQATRQGQHTKPHQITIPTAEEHIP